MCLWCYLETFVSYELQHINITADYSRLFIIGAAIQYCISTLCVFYVGLVFLQLVLLGSV